MRAPGGATEIRPKVTSTFAISPRIDFETRLDLAEWNSGANLLAAKFDTRLHVQAPAPFLDELEGRVWRSPDGQSGRILGLGFYQTLSQPSRASKITIRSRATLETTSSPALAASVTAAPANVATRRVGLETEVGGFMSTPRNAMLRLKILRTVGRDVETTRSLGYDRTWTVHRAILLAMSLGVLQDSRNAAQNIEPSLGIRWRGTF